MNGRIERPGESRLILPRVGKIKIGTKSERGYPMSVDYFIPDGKYSSFFTKAYGDKPSTIQIIFPSDNCADVCNEEYEYRDDEGKIIAKGDGQTFQVWSKTHYVTKTVAEVPDLMQKIQDCFPTKISKSTGNGWKVRLTLSFVVPLVREVGGVWVFESNGNVSTIPNICNTFDAMLSQRGSVKGVIFDLNVSFAKSQKPGDKSRFPVVTLIPNQSQENIAKITEAMKPICAFPPKNSQKVLEN